MQDTIVWILAGASLFCLSLTYQSWGDVLYSVTKNWKATLFVTACMTCGAVSGFALTSGNMFALASPVAAIARDITQPSEEKVLATIRNCKLFIAAAAEGRSPPQQTGSLQSPLLHLASASAPDWDRCARTFGLNYWKHDISVAGRLGGRTLCQAYARQTDYRSDEVESWCATVLRDR